MLNMLKSLLKVLLAALAFISGAVFTIIIRMWKIILTCLAVVALVVYIIRHLATILELIGKISRWLPKLDSDGFKTLWHCSLWLILWAIAVLFVCYRKHLAQEEITEAEKIAKFFRERNVQTKSLATGSDTILFFLTQELKNLIREVPDLYRELRYLLLIAGMTIVAAIQTFHVMSAYDVRGWIAPVALWLIVTTATIIWLEIKWWQGVILAIPLPHSSIQEFRDKLRTELFRILAAVVAIIECAAMFNIIVWTGGMNASWYWTLMLVLVGIMALGYRAGNKFQNQDKNLVAVNTLLAFCIVDFMFWQEWVVTKHLNPIAFVMAAIEVIVIVVWWVKKFAKTEEKNSSGHVIHKDDEHKESFFKTWGKTLFWAAFIAAVLIPSYLRFYANSVMHQVSSGVRMVLPPTANQPQAPAAPAAGSTAATKSIMNPAKLEAATGCTKANRTKMILGDGKEHRFSSTGAMQTGKDYHILLCAEGDLRGLVAWVGNTPAQGTETGNFWQPNATDMELNVDPRFQLEPNAKQPDQPAIGGYLHVTAECNTPGCATVYVAYMPVNN